MISEEPSFDDSRIVLKNGIFFSVCVIDLHQCIVDTVTIYGSFSLTSSAGAAMKTLLKKRGGDLSPRSEKSI